MAAATATLSERIPGRIGMTSLVSAVRCTSWGVPAELAAEQQNVARTKSVIEIGQLCMRREQDQPDCAACRQAANALQLACRASGTVEVVHARATKGAIRSWETRPAR